MDDIVKINLVNGVEGSSLYIDDYRVAGNKPWGGGVIARTFKAKRSDILKALKVALKPDTGE
jgi:hypothetical protein